jgi:hypothetical protein
VDPHEVVQVHRRHLVETMQQYTRLKGDGDEDDVALALVLDAELFRLESVVRWLDVADARLRRMAQVTPEPTSAARPLRRRSGATR